MKDMLLRLSQPHKAYRASNNRITLHRRIVRNRGGSAWSSSSRYNSMSRLSKASRRRKVPMAFRPFQATFKGEGPQRPSIAGTCPWANRIPARQKRSRISQVRHSKDQALSLPLNPAPERTRRVKITKLRTSQRS